MKEDLELVIIENQVMSMNARRCGFAILFCVAVVLAVILRSCSASDGTRPVWEFDGHDGAIYSVAFSRDGSLALSTGENDWRIWEMKSGRLLKSIPPGWAELVVSPLGDLVAASNHNVVHVFSTRDWNEITSFAHPDVNVISQAFSQDGKWIVVGTGERRGTKYSNTVRVWDARTGKEVRVFQGHLGAVCAVAFMPDGNHVLSASSDWTIRLWSLETGSETRRYGTAVVGGGDPELRLSVSPDGKFAFRGPLLINLDTWGRVDWLEDMPAEAPEITICKFSPDGKHVLSGGTEGKIRLHEFPSGKVIWSEYSNLNHTKVTALAFSPDGRLAISGGWGYKGAGSNRPGPMEDHKVRVWKLPE